MTVMGDASMDGLSDAGSTPARSTKKVPIFRYFFLFVLYFVLHRCEKGPAKGLLKLCKGDGLGSLSILVFGFSDNIREQGLDV